MSIRTSSIIILALMVMSPAVRADYPPHIWSQNFGDSAGQYGLGLAVDGSGNVILTGFFEGTVDFGGGPLTAGSVGIDSDIYLAKFDASGNHIWSQRFGDTDHYWDGAMGVAVGVSGNATITGFFENTVNFGGGVLTSAGGGNDIFVAKFDANGGHIWSRRFGDTDDESGYGVAADGSGNDIVTGSFQDTVDFGGGTLTSAGGDDIFVAKFDASGNHIWSQRFGDGSRQLGQEVAVDGSGNVIVTGEFAGAVNFGGGVLTSAGGSDIFVAKFDASGNHIWSDRFGDTSSDVGYSVTVDGGGNVVATGHFAGTVNFGGGPLTSAGSIDIFVAKFDAGGNHIWSQHFGDADGQLGRSVAVDGSGNVIITGELWGTADFGGGAITSAGGTDIFLAKFDSSGNHIWSEAFGDGDGQHGYAVAADGSGNVIGTGAFSGTVDFGGGTMTGNWDIFLAKFGPTATGIVAAPIGYQLGIQGYPNPFNPATTIAYSLPKTGFVSLGVYDVQGRLLKTLVNETRTMGEHAVTWNGQDASGTTVASGVYFVRLEFGGQVRTRKIVLLK
jgi:uncharacterized protein (AIM24 family)